MALMDPKITALIAKRFCPGRIHRYAHGGLRFLAKSSGFASALGQKMLWDASETCPGLIGPRFHRQKPVPEGAPINVLSVKGFCHQKFVVEAVIGGWCTW